MDSSPPEEVDISLDAEDFLEKLLLAWESESPGSRTHFHVPTPGNRIMTVEHPGLPDGRAGAAHEFMQELQDAGLIQVNLRRFGDGGPRGRLIITSKGRDHIYDRRQATVVLLPSIAREVQVESAANEVFVVYGRNRTARNQIFNILRAVGIRPLDFEQASELTGRTSPYIGDVLAAAFRRARAIVVLFTDDEWVELREDLRAPNEEVGKELQSRPNVIFEAGMALGLQPNRTLIVEMGQVRQFSDLAGRHVVRWGVGDVAIRQRLLQRLSDAGCTVDYSSQDWMTI